MQTLDYDVSVLVLESPLTFSDSIQPIALTSSEPAAGVEAVVSGWGTTENGNLPYNLKEVHVHIISREECQNEYRGGITAQMICAADKNKDSCQVSLINDKILLLPIVTYVNISLI